jgi:hypothetical protein
MPTLYAPPVIPQFPAGYGPFAADFNGWVQSTMGFLTQDIVFRAERHASQTIPTNTTTKIQYDTVLEDPYSGWNASTFEWLAPYTGWYLATTTSTVSAAAGAVAAAVGTPETEQYGAMVQVTATLFGGCSAEQIVPLTGGVDYVYGATWTSFSATTNTTNGRYPTLEILFVSQ